MKFRKKPIVVEAEQFFVSNKHWPEGVQRFDEGHDLVIYQIRTLEGWMRVSEGDWIITGVRNEKYPIKDSIFRETYEEVLDA